jgi:hypothetical protein
LWSFMKNKWWLTSRFTQNTSSKPKGFTIFTLILRDIDAMKTRFQPAKTQKMTNFKMTFEFKILILFMKNLYWLTSRTTQNKTWNIKISTFFPLSKEKSMLIKRFFSQRNRRN